MFSNEESKIINQTSYRGWLYKVKDKPRLTLMMIPKYISGGETIHFNSGCFGSNLQISIVLLTSLYKKLDPNKFDMV